MNNLPGGAWALHRPYYDDLVKAAAAPLPRVDAKGKSPRPIDRDGVRIIPVSGILLPSVPAWMRYVGLAATSYRWLAQQVADALHDPGVERIHLLVNSPGGSVAGIDEATETVDGAGRLKLLTAHTGSLCASAAYWLASQAHTVTASKTATVGSIGVYTIVDDTSAAALASGVKVNVISSGPLKGAGVDGSPVLPEHLASEQAIVDGIAGEFFAAVARGRGRRVGKPAEWTTGAAWCASDALALGLVDGISNTSEGI